MTVKLKTAIGTYGHTKPLKDGTVRSQAIEFEHLEITPIIAAFRRMVRGVEFDVSEMAISTYLCARAFHKPFTAIPVFPVRAFHHGAIAYNVKSGVKSPKDLEGKKVGVNRGYTVTTGLWARGILQSQYGVDLNKITWVLNGDEHVAEWKAPPNVASVPGGDLAKMLIAGEIAAAIGVGQVDNPDIKPLIPNPRQTAYQWCRETGIYPINHTVVVKDELLAKEPGVAVELFNAFKAAKQRFLERLRAGAPDLSAEEKALGELTAVVGPDPLPYGLKANRKVMETVIQFNYDQKIIPRKVTVEEVFVKNTLNLE